MDILTKKMYIPDPKKWIDYYHSVSSGNTNPYIMYGRMNQRGGVLMGSSNQFMIPLEKKTQLKLQQIDLPKVQLAEQVVQQAKDGLREGIKRKRTEHSVIPKKRRRRSNTS